MAKLPFCLGEIFRSSPVYLTLDIILTFVGTAFSAFSSTYYIKILVSDMENNAPFSRMAVLIAGFAAAEMVLFVFEMLLNQLDQNYVRPAYQKRFNLLLFKKAGDVDLECYENPDFYDKYTRAMDGTHGRIMSVCYSFTYIITEFFRIAYLLWFMMSIDPGVGFFLIFPMIGNFIIGRKLNSIEQKRYKEDTKFTRIRSYVTRTLHLARYSKEMRLTRVYDLVQDKHERSVRGTFGVYDKYAFRGGATYWLKVQFTFTMIFEALLVYCAYKAIVAQTMSLSEVTVLSSTMISASWQIIGLSDDIVDVQKECLYIQNARDFLSYEAKIPEDLDGDPVPDVIETIEFKNVSYTYTGKDEPTLKNVSIRLDRGEHVALVGRNGAGKTTLVKLLLRLYDPDEGEILVNGKNIKEFNLADYRASFATAFQDYQVLAMTVLENLTMAPPEDADRLRAKEILEKVGLWEKVSRLDKGLDTLLTKEFSDDGIVLSGGEAQKLAVARALMKRDKYSVFDEPSSALDPIAEYELFRAVMDETENAASLIISHRLSSAKLADRIIVLEDGAVVQTGTHSELIGQSGVYRDMFIRQARNYLADDEIGGEA